MRLKINETTYTVSQSGSLKIPAVVMRGMGLGPGDHVRVAYLSRDGEQNTFREFFLSEHGIEDMAENSEDSTIAIPEELLQRAKLSDSSNFQILCREGCIVICQDPGFTLEELHGLLKQLQQANDITMDIEPPDDDMNWRGDSIYDEWHDA